MANPKYHWAILVSDPSKHRHAWKAYAGGHYIQACGRKKKSAVGYSAERFAAKVQRNPDWYCSDCAKAARLALAAESAPKPSDVVWPKPRPISEAPTDGSCVLGHWSVSGYPRLRGCRWAVVKPGSGLAWFNEQNEPLSEPDYFLPLPPEVK